MGRNVTGNDYSRFWGIKPSGFEVAEQFDHFLGHIRENLNFVVYIVQYLIMQVGM
jgi:hypothetical protein